MASGYRLPRWLMLLGFVLVCSLGAALFAARSLLFVRWAPPENPLLRSQPEARPNASVDLSGPGILAKMAAAYESCRSYEDKGVVRTTFHEPHGFVEEEPFETSFVRGGGFRFGV